VVERLVVCERFAAVVLAAVEGFAGVGFLPSHENAPACDDFLAFFAELGEPDNAGRLFAEDAGRALVADDSVLMLGPRVTLPA
jgi:hypothetical protein